MNGRGGENALELLIYLSAKNVDVSVDTPFTLQLSTRATYCFQRGSQLIMELIYAR